ncbi:unnamed protein product [Urochloa humidicola]
MRGSPVQRVLAAPAYSGESRRPRLTPTGATAPSGSGECRRSASAVAPAALQQCVEATGAVHAGSGARPRGSRAGAERVHAEVEWSLPVWTVTCPN